MFRFLNFVCRSRLCSSSSRFITNPDDHVRKLSKYEEELYQQLAGIADQPASTLSSKWREPSLTVHNVEISGPKSRFSRPPSLSWAHQLADATVIPGRVAAQVSLRIVPDQDLDTIADSMCRYLQTSFEGLHTPNKLTVHILPARFLLCADNNHLFQLSLAHKADWWLGDLEDDWFRKLEEAIESVWGVTPLRIREGGVRVLFYPPILYVLRVYSRFPPCPSWRRCLGVMLCICHLARVR